MGCQRRSTPKHGSWTIVMRTRGFLITKTPRNLFLWTSLRDFCEVCPVKLPNYEEKIKNLSEEHPHHLLLHGRKDYNDSWIRVWVKKGGMIVLPAGIYHRFTLDTDNYIK
ncbi:hypothetical protein Tsubulata_036196, partial [Turnera subulata]